MNKKGSLIIIIILTILSAFLIGYLIFRQNKVNNENQGSIIKDDKTKLENNKQIQPEETNNNKDDQKSNNDQISNDNVDDDQNNNNQILKSLYESTGDESSLLKVFLTTDQKILIESPEINKQLFENNVEEAYTITSGQSSICLGNTWVVVKENDGTTKAVSLDKISCGGEVKFIDITSELKNQNIENYKSIYSKSTYINEYEPELSKVYATTSNNEEIEITEIFSKN